MVNQVSLPAQAYSASLHPDKSVFVAGGEDFKIYKFAYDDGKEMGMSLTVLYGSVYHTIAYNVPLSI